MENGWPASAPLPPAVSLAVTLLMGAAACRHHAVPVYPAPNDGLPANHIRVTPAELASDVLELAELARAVADGSTDNRILRAYGRLHVRLADFSYTPPPDALDQALAEKNVLAPGLPFISEALPPVWREFGADDYPGRMTALVQHPADEDTFYAGAAGGGVWKTIDAGTTWEPLTDRIGASLAIGAVAIDPFDPRIVYAGTGEGNYAADWFLGSGLLKSTDEGTSWTEIRDFPPCLPPCRGRACPEPPSFPTHFHDLVADSGREGRLWAATTTGLFRSDDRGGSWTCIDDLPAPDTPSFAVMSGTPAVHLAAVWGRGGRAPRGSGIYRSLDDGATWTKATLTHADGSLVAAESVGRVALGPMPFQPALVYAAASDATTGGLLGVFRSADGGATFAAVGGSRELAAGSPCNDYCWYCLAISGAPANLNPVTEFDSVLLGGVQVLISDNSGQGWVQAASTGLMSDLLHDDVHRLVPVFRDGVPELWAATDGGIYKTADRGQTWEMRSGGLRTTQHYHLTSDPGDPGVAIAATQDQGVLVVREAEATRQLLGGDGECTAAPLGTPGTYYASERSVGLVRFTEGGLCRYPIGQGIDRGSRRTSTSPPFILGASFQASVLYGASRLWRSMNEGNAFAAVSGDFSATGVVGAIADSLTDAEVWVGTDEGKVWVGTPATPSWTWVERSAGLPARAVTSIARHPVLEDVAYLTVSGFGTPHVYRTEDGGLTWQPRSGAPDRELPDYPTNQVLIAASEPLVLLLATDLGVFRSDDAGECWYDFGMATLPDVPVSWMSRSPSTGTLRVGTYGRGIWEIRALDLGTSALECVPR